MHPIAKLDHAHVWHPFTQMREWLSREPVVIVSGRGATLRDVHGREYLDANASIWTNLHGHGHPRINAAIRRQLKKIAHSSALGFANEPASLLAAKLVEMAASPAVSHPAQASKNPVLPKVFFSDDGSTAIEVALKLAYEFTRRSRGSKGRPPRFLGLEGAYHGDTIGAVSLGHIDLFHAAYGGMLFAADKVMAPYCYRCPFNRARAEQGDARDYGRCNWECVDKVEARFASAKKRGNPYAGFVFEPLMQGSAGMIPQPAGWLRRVAEIARGHGALLIADEVMTGFGRTGTVPSAIAPTSLPVGGPESACGVCCSPSRRPAPAQSAIRNPQSAICFACHHEGVQPDFLCVAKGLTGGYLPMAATLATQDVFDTFLGEYAEFKTFFHGHSFTGNQLGSAAALASLDLLLEPASIRARVRLEQVLREELVSLTTLPQVGDVRQVGLVVGVELVRNWRTRRPFEMRERAGIRVCEAMARRGVLTRPVGSVVVLMPPYCTTEKQARRMVGALREAIGEAFAGRGRS
jgi:adenosylmethionine-8-amino-7-oxononanoate aminotransferase